MIKINSKYIKDNIECIHCDSTKLKRSHKQTFKTHSLFDKTSEKLKYEFRQFTCSECEEITNVTNTEQQILNYSEISLLPFSCFNFYIEYEEELHLWLFYKDTVKGDILQDDIGEGNIIDFHRFFSQYNIFMENASENNWIVTFDKNVYDFNSFKEGLDILKEIIQKTGASYTPEDCQFTEKELLEHDVNFSKNNIFI